jgi:hypothetical protein
MASLLTKGEMGASLCSPSPRRPLRFPSCPNSAGIRFLARDGRLTSPQKVQSCEVRTQQSHFGPFESTWHTFRRREQASQARFRWPDESRTVVENSMAAFLMPRRASGLPGPRVVTRLWPSFRPGSQKRLSEVCPLDSNVNQIDADRQLLIVQVEEDLMIEGRKLTSTKRVK